MKLTDRQILSAKCPPNLNQFDLRDDQVRGLVVRVYTSGVKTWGVFYRRKQDNKRRWLKLGLYPGLSLKEARKLAEIQLGRIAAGEDPQAEREETRARGGVETVADLARDYLDLYAKYKRPASYAMDRWQLDTYVLPRWGKRPVGEVTKRDVMALLEDVASGKLAPRGRPTKVAPRSLRALLSKLFNWSVDQGLLAGNPASGVKLPASVREHLKKGGRDRVLSEAEIRALWEDLDRMEKDARTEGMGMVTAAAFRLMLLTAQRSGEVFSMRWRNIDNGWWVVPAEVAKNGEANRVYLSPQAQAILSKVEAETGGSEWVFASGRRAKGPLGETSSDAGRYVEAYSLPTPLGGGREYSQEGAWQHVGSDPLQDPAQQVASCAPPFSNLSRRWEMRVRKTPQGDGRHPVESRTSLLDRPTSGFGSCGSASRGRSASRMEGGLMRRTSAL